MKPLERPVLSLTIDAVVKMSGEDALCGLLTLFHKCKEGLQDGDRLENMAWRLWHVERSSSQICFPTPAALSSPGLVASPLTSSSSSSSEDASDVSSDGETWDQDQAMTVHEDTGASNYKEPSPTLSKSLSPFPVAPHGRHTLKRERSSRRSPSPASAASRKTSPSRRPSLSSRRTHSNTSVGQIMADLLPEKLDLYRSPSLNALTEHNHWHERSLMSRSNGEEVPAVVIMPDVPLEQPQARPSPPQVDRSMRFPTVVIVNPTPHPTPPMTPQVSPPPTSPPTCSGVSLMPRRDTLTVVTHVRSPTSPTLPPTPESMGQKERDEDRPPPSYPEAKNMLCPPASGPGSSNNRSNSRSSSDSEHSSGIAGAGKSAMQNGSSNMFRLGANAPSAGASGSSLNLPERKFFIAQTGSPDGDSPDTSASSQVGSQSALSVSIAMSTALDKRAAEVAAACEPASVASRASAGTARSHSSNGSSSRGGGMRMKSRKGAVAASSAKGKGKETRQGHGASHMHRTQSSGRIHRMQTGPGGLTGGTIQRSKLGGRTAAASAHAAALASSHFGKQQSVRAPTSGTPMHPPSPAPVSKPAQAEKSAVASSSGARPGSTVRQSTPSQRSSRSGGSGKVAKTSGQVLPSSSLRQRRLDFADDSDYSTDTEWDTEDVSEEADGTSGDNEQAVVDRKLAEAAAEAQRQRDLFAKVDRRSYSDLSRVRTQPGLLSAIFHPDPQLFPPDHPYRHSRSTQDILAHTSRPSYPAAPLQPSKSTAAVPVAATVTAQSVSAPNQMHNRQRSPLRLKGRPQDVEESESGEDDEDNKLHISESAAEKRLAMLQRQHTKGAREQEPSKLAQQAPINRQPPQPNVLPAAGQPPAVRRGAPTAGPSPLARVATEPVPLGYPYNLPPPVPPSTPRTTRRNMLTHELSESLRRNLLWERQVSKQRPMGLGRRAVTNSAVPTAGPSNLRPLTSTTTVAPNTNGQAGGNNSQPGGSGGNSVTGASNDTANGAPAANDEQSAKDERQEKVIARNRSWADTYHAAGW